MLKGKKDYYKSETLSDLIDYKRANTKLKFHLSAHPYLYKHILSLKKIIDNPNAKKL